MSPKSAQRFWDNDMRKINNLKRVARVRFYATRFNDGSGRPGVALFAGAVIYDTNRARRRR